MENKELNINELVVIEQLPQIFYQLEVVGEVIDKELEKVKELKATEENKQEVKKIRIGINNTLKEFEDKRKEIKNKILEDYNLFNEKYENETGRTIKDALRGLDNKPSTIAMVIGPEGGFSDDEAEQLKSIGADCVSLGKTILRTETAGMAALAMVMYELEL